MMASSSTPAGVAAQLVGLLQRLEEREGYEKPQKVSMMAEVRTLELWRAVIAECLATVFYVFLLCGAYSPWTGKPPTYEAHIIIALVSGFSMAVLIHSFGQISGGHINPVVSVALAVTRKVSPLRAAMYVLAQLGGAIAGAALLYGATSSVYTGDLGATVVSRVITVWQGFGLEFILTVVVVFVFCASMNPYRRLGGSPAVAVGLAYLACTLVGFPLTGASVNPARSLGPAFVMNKWDAHWVYWVAPLLGGITAGLIYEYIFNPHRMGRSRKDSVDGDSSSVGSDEEAYDECSKPPPRYNYNAVHAQHYDQFHPANSSANSPLGYGQTVYTPSGATSVCSAPAYKYISSFHGANKEEIYSGSKSLYSKSPSLPRAANLNRSQSVYTRPPPPRTDNYSRNITHSQNMTGKSPAPFTPLTQVDTVYSKNNTRQESLYVSSKQASIIKPEPIYGGSAVYTKQDSGDSSYSTYRGSGSYSSSRSSVPPPLPLSRSRNNTNTLNSGLATPSSMASYHSPNPQY